MVREPVDGLVWRVRESRFTFLTDRGLVGEGSDTDSDSEGGPDGNGVSPSATTVGRLAGGGAILIPRLAGVFLLRERVVDCMMSSWGQNEMTTCVLLRERKKKEDIRQKGRDADEQQILQTDEGLLGTIEERRMDGRA